MLHLMQFQHTAARRRLAGFYLLKRCFFMFQHTAARRRLGLLRSILFGNCCFNTQPPEGGWVPENRKKTSTQCFNTQPPEGGWFLFPSLLFFLYLFQHTAARRRLEVLKI
mgnify:CR=1 FL=1